MAQSQKIYEKAIRQAGQEGVCLQIKDLRANQFQGDYGPEFSYKINYLGDDRAYLQIKERLHGALQQTITAPQMVRIVAFDSQQHKGTNWCIVAADGTTSYSDDLPAYQAPQQQAPPPNQSTPPPQQQAPPAGPPAREATMKKSELQAELQGAVSIAVYTLQQFDLPILDSYSVAKLACQVMVSADRAGLRLAKGAEAPTQAPPQQQAPPPAQQQESAPPPNPSGLPTPYDADDDDLPF